MLDLTTPTNHASAYDWTVVALAHGFIAMVLIAVIAAILDRWPRLAVFGTGLTAMLILAVGYGIGWEGLVQLYGAGLADAALDSFMVLSGAGFGLAIWWHKRAAAVGIVATVSAVLWAGIRRRK